MKKLTCLFALILLAGITFTGRTQNAPVTDISDFKLSMRIMIDETDPIALRVKGYLITAFREVPDIAIVKSGEDVVLQVSVATEGTAHILINGVKQTYPVYIGAATPHRRIPPEFIEIIDLLTEGIDFEMAITSGNLLTPVWVGQTSVPFYVLISGTKAEAEAELERQCAKVVSNLNTLLHNDWESFISVSEMRSEMRKRIKER